MSVTGYLSTKFCEVSRKSEPGNPHGWNSRENYFQVHTHRMQVLYDEGFVLDDGLSVSRLRFDSLVFEGRVRCLNGLFIDVEKFLAIREIGGRIEVRTTTYSYHAGIEGSQDRPIFRYDNFHPYSREGHSDPHHKHVFDPKTWSEVSPPEWIGEEQWPYLSDAIERVAAVVEDHRALPRSRR